eukprot:1411832-Rhodomonas_salina.3
MASPISASHIAVHTLSQAECRQSHRIHDATYAILVTDIAQRTRRMLPCSARPGCLLLHTPRRVAAAKSHFHARNVSVVCKHEIAASRGGNTVRQYGGRPAKSRALCAECPSNEEEAT